MALPGPFQLLSSAWQTYRSHVWTFIKLVIIPSLLTLVLVGILAVIFAATGALDIQTLKLPQLGILLPAIIAAAVFATIISLLGRTATIWFIHTSDKPRGIILLFKEVWPLLWKFFRTQILAGAIIFFGFVLLIIPGLIFAVRFIFVPFIVMVENLSGPDALRQSRAYVKGKFWGVLGRSLFIGLFAAIVSAISSRINQPLITGLIQLLMALIYAPLSTIYFYNLYQACKLGVNELPAPRRSTPAPIT